jgi:hypothetical protein
MNPHERKSHESPYTAEALTTGDGHARASDGKLDLELQR